MYLNITRIRKMRRIPGDKTVDRIVTHLSICRLNPMRC